MASEGQDPSTGSIACILGAYRASNWLQPLACLVVPEIGMLACMPTHRAFRRHPSKHTSTDKPHQFSQVGSGLGNLPKTVQIWRLRGHFIGLGSPRPFHRVNCMHSWCLSAKQLAPLALHSAGIQVITHTCMHARSQGIHAGMHIGVKMPSTPTHRPDSCMHACMHPAKRIAMHACRPPRAEL